MSKIENEIAEEMINETNQICKAVLNLSLVKIKENNLNIDSILMIYITKLTALILAKISYHQLKPMQIYYEEFLEIIDPLVTKMGDELIEGLKKEKNLIDLYFKKTNEMFDKLNK